MARVYEISRRLALTDILFQITPSANMSIFLAVGCYNKPPHAPTAQQNSIFIIKLEKETGSMSIVTKYDDVPNASYFSKNNDRLWVASEGSVSALTQYKIRRFEARSVPSGQIESTPLLELEKSIDFEDAGACFVSSKEQKDGSVQVNVACYDSGVVRTFKSVGEDLMEEDKMQLIGCADEKQEETNRQEAPHAHCVVPWKGCGHSLAVAQRSHCGQWMAF